MEVIVGIPASVTVADADNVGVAKVVAVTVTDVNPDILLGET